MILIFFREDQDFFMPMRSGRTAVRPCILIFAFCLLIGRPSWALRIVSLLPSNTEVLEALHSGDEIVGVTVFDRKNEGRELVGDLAHPNLEKIVSLKPDLIAAGLWQSSRTVPRLREMGYKVVEIPNPRSIQEIYRTIHMLANAVGRPELAYPVIDSMKQRFARLRNASNQLPHAFRTYIEIDRGLWTVGGPDFITEAFRFAGVENIFSDIPKEAAQVSSEVVVERNPDLIIVFNESKAEIARRPGWQNIRAVRQGAILDQLDHDALVRPSPRLLDGLEALLAALQELARSQRMP